MLLACIGLLAWSASRARLAAVPQDRMVLGCLSVAAAAGLAVEIGILAWSQRRSPARGMFLRERSRVFFKLHANGSLAGRPRGPFDWVMTARRLCADGRVAALVDSGRELSGAETDFVFLDLREDFEQSLGSLRLI